MEIVDCRAEKGLRRIEKISRAAFFDEEVESAVAGILNKVRRMGDKALIEFTQKFDNYSLSPAAIKVKDEILDLAFSNLPKGLLASLKFSRKNIEEYAKKQLKKSWAIKRKDGSEIGLEVRPIEKVGVYVPGGTAPLVSTVLMTVLIARVAGVKEIYVATPPCCGGDINPAVLGACRFSGVDAVFRIGGAQAVAAFAFGTESIPRVDKIIGPGNIFVSCAKKQVYGLVDVDMVAGPSEVMIVADKSAKIPYAAADMLAQAEHDASSRIFLVSDSVAVLEEAEREAYKQAMKLSRKRILSESLRNNTFLVLVRDKKQAVDVINLIGPEHLEIMSEDADYILKRTDNAGAVFVGDWSPEAVGDYIAGPSHVLPTGGRARFFSALSVSDFLKNISTIRYSRDGLRKASKYAIELSDTEGLGAHGNSIKIRLKENCR
ncbi:MAG: histidinol dehydrogenase [Candidatus Aureabacteria bacterium]|nr:histidinol dehydrogenase [Candidatus Auribacterota bacterium]